MFHQPQSTNNQSWASLINSLQSVYFTGTLLLCNKCLLPLSRAIATWTTNTASIQSDEVEPTLRSRNTLKNRAIIWEVTSIVFTLIRKGARLAYVMRLKAVWMVFWKSKTPWICLVSLLSRHVAHSDRWNPCLDATTESLKCFVLFFEHENAIVFGPKKRQLL